MKSKDLKRADLEKMAKAEEIEAEHSNYGLTDSLSDLKAGRIGSVHRSLKPLNKPTGRQAKRMSFYASRRAAVQQARALSEIVRLTKEIGQEL